MRRNKNKEEIKDLNKIEPIDYGVVAKPHTPIYKMHKYFARRPYTVFNELIKHYSNPGSIILDPMCGGGVTIVEGLRLRRKVIGVDLNPMAIFITRCEVMDVDLDKLKKAFYQISEKVKDEINSFYLTKCPECGKETPAEWFEWSSVVICDNCKKEVAFSECKKNRGGLYSCIACNHHIVPSKSSRVKDKMIHVKVDCPCGCKKTKTPDTHDIARYEEIVRTSDNTLKQRGLEIPLDKIIDGDRPKDDALYTKGFTHYYQLFTTRNLLACAILKKAIQSMDFPGDSLMNLMLFTFSATLGWVSRMSSDTGHGWQIHGFWVPEIFYETNVWKMFQKRFDGRSASTVIKGKQESQRDIANYFRLTENYTQLLNTKTCFIITKDATNLPLPDVSVDAIITDPPYGGNVQYSELCNFYIVWLKEILNVDGPLTNDREAISTRHTGHSQVKTLEEYRRTLYNIFKECYRVLKPNRWMVMTFHNREFKVWNAIHLAAHDAGFTWSEKDGMIYQPPIQHYTPTLHLRASGAMKGDFILSYRKAEKPPKEKWIEEVEVGKKIRETAKQAIIYHGGAKLSTIYMRVMPFLLNSGRLEEIKETDLESYLRKDFVKKDDKWYLKESVDEETGSLLDKTIEEYAPVKDRLESIIRRFLARGKAAKIDEILQVVYSRLINSNAAEYEEIVHVVNRICVKVKSEKGRESWQLREERDKGLLFQVVKEKVEYKYSEESDHDIIIEQLMRLGKKSGYESHIGLTEQKKDKNFRELSIPMGSNIQFGLNEIAFNKIREIDVLWIKNVTITTAFEVEKSTTIDSGITRFRELFAATPTLNIPAYIIIPDKREEEAKKKIGSLANRRDGLTQRIKYILFSDLLNKADIDLIKVAREVM